MTSSSRVHGALRALWRTHRADVDELIGEMRAAVEEPTMTNCEQATRAAHRLAGSLGTFGLAEGTWRARRLEALFGDTTKPIDQLELAFAINGLAEVVERFDDDVAVAAAAAEPSTDPTPQPLRRQQTVAVVGFHRPEADELTAAAAAGGLSTWVVDDLAAVVAGGDDERGVTAVVVDVDRIELSDPDGSPWSSSAPPVIAVSGGRRLADRVAATRRGARRYIQRPATAADIVASVESTWTPPRRTATVVAVDDDPMVLDLLRVVLRTEDIALIAVDDQEQFWKAVHDHQPDVVMLDVDMPGISGIELCRVLRTDDQWQQTGVIFLTAHRDAATVHAVFEAGADDMVVKPIIGPELRARIASRIDRTDLHRRLAESDGLTGLTNRSTSQRTVERMVADAAGSGRPLAVTLVDLDHFKAINDDHGHHIGDDVLRRFAELARAVHPSLAGRWGGEEFLLVFDGRDAEAAAGVVGDLLESLCAESFSADDGRTFQCSFSAGVAALVTSDERLDGLIRRADDALYRAKAAGRRQVVVAGPG